MTRVRRRRLLALLPAVAAAACFRRELPVETCGSAWCLEVREQLAAEPPGAAQSIDLRDGLIWVGFDGSTGLIQGYRLDGRELRPQSPALRLTRGGDDEIPHPTGLSHHDALGTFVGHSPSGPGRLYLIDWNALLAGGDLDGAIVRRIADGASVRGTRPEPVRLGERWLVASADYGKTGNEVRLHDPERLASADDTAQPGVVVARFPSTPWVQALVWWDEQEALILVQNTSFGDGWRLTFVDLAASVSRGEMQVLDVLEPDLSGELQDIALLDSGGVLLVTNHRARFAYTGRLRRAAP